MRRIILALGLMGICAGALWGGSERKTYEQAIKGNPNDGIVVFLYGPDWEKEGPQFLKKQWQNPKLKNACGGANLVALPIYQRPDEKEKKTADDKSKGFKRTKNVRSIPALVLQDYSGRDYYVICGDELAQPVEKVVELMKAKFELYKQQRKLIQQAEKAKGRAKARAYAQAATIEGILPPKDHVKIIKENDPKLEEPLSARAVFNIYELLVDQTTYDKDNPSKKILSTEETLEKLKALTGGETYTPVQKQEIYAAAVGHLRRKGYDNTKVKKLYQEMIALDPDSIWADYAKHAIRIWCK